MNAEQLLAHYERVFEAPDAIARLRRFVLDLAVRGKLVPQIAGEKQHPDLLERLKKCDVLQPNLPRGWQLLSVGSLLEFQYGSGLKSDDRLSDGPVPVYGSNGVVGFTDKALTETPSIIVGRKGSAGALNLCDGPSWTTDVAYFVETPSYFHLRYLFNVLTTLELGKLAKGVKPGLSRSDAYQLLVSIPPLDEQHRIVTKVDELMALCDILETTRAQREATRSCLAAASFSRLNAPNERFQEDVRFVVNVLPILTTRAELIQGFRHTILNLAVHGKLVPQVAEDRPISVPEANSSGGPHEIPGNWAWFSTDQICSLIVDCPHSTPRFECSGVLCIDTNSFKEGRLIKSKLRYVSEKTYNERVRRLSPSAGDVVFAREGSVGESVVIPEGTRCCLGQRVMLFRPAKSVSSRYFHLALSVPSTLQQLLALHKGIGAKHVNVRDMRKAQIPVPPLAEQNRIVAKVDELMMLCAQLEASLARGEHARIRLLNALLTQQLSQTQPAPEAWMYPLIDVAPARQKRLA